MLYEVIPAMIRFSKSLAVLGLGYARWRHSGEVFCLFIGWGLRSIICGSRFFRHRSEAARWCYAIYKLQKSTSAEVQCLTNSAGNTERGIARIIRRKSCQSYAWSISYAYVILSRYRSASVCLVPVVSLEPQAFTVPLPPQEIVASDPQ